MLRPITILALFASVSIAIADPCKSGLEPNQRPGPYSALVCVGKERGTQHCYICEAENRPLVIVFTRNANEPLGKLVKKLDGAVKEHKAVELRSWVTFLAADQAALDPQIVKWAQKHAVSVVPCAVFEDTVGPPAYRLSKDAEVTVLLAVNRKVVANFAYRAGELDDAAIAEIVKAVPKIIKK